MGDGRRDGELARALGEWVSTTHAVTADEIRQRAGTRSGPVRSVSPAFVVAVLVFVAVAGGIGWAAIRGGSDAEPGAPVTGAPDTTTSTSVAQLLPWVSGCSVPSGVRGPNDAVEPAFSAIVSVGLVPAADVVAVNATMPGFEGPGVAIAVDRGKPLPEVVEQAIAEAAGTTPVVVVQRCASVAEVGRAATALRSDGLAGVDEQLIESAGGFGVSVDTLRGLVEVIGPHEVTSRMLAASGVDPSIVEVTEGAVSLGSRPG